MDCKPDWVRPFFPADLLWRPVEPEACRTIFIELGTAMLRGKPKEKTEQILEALCKVVSDTFQGRYEVEAFVADFDPEARVVLHAKAHGTQLDTQI